MLDCSPVGAPSRALTIACALVLALVPVAAGANRDLRVSVSRLTVPAKLASGKAVSFGVLYTVRGPAARRAQATVRLVLNSDNNTSTYTVTSLPATVRPAIWRWRVTDKLPALKPGSYVATATITLRRGAKVVASTAKTANVQVTTA